MPSEASINREESSGLPKDFEEPAKGDEPDDDQLMVYGEGEDWIEETQRIAEKIRVISHTSA